MTQISGADTGHKRMQRLTFGLAAAGRLARRRAEAAASLRRRLVIAVGAGIFLLLAALVALGADRIRHFMGGQADGRLTDDAHRTALLVERLLADRQREARMIAASPRVVDAAREGTRRARALSIVGRPVAELERQFDTTRTLNVDPRVQRWFVSLEDAADVVEAIVTEEHGYNVVTSERTSDFVQSDESWWSRAWREGILPAEAVYDSSARQTVLAIAAAIRESDGDRPLGVLKIDFGMRKMDEALARASAYGGIQVDLVDLFGNVVASSGDAPRMRPLVGYDGLAAAPNDSILTYVAGSTRQRAAVLHVNSAQWRLVAHADERVAFADYYSARDVLFGGALAVFLFTVAALNWASRFVARRVSDPARELAVAAEAVASGDFSVTVRDTGADDEIGRLSRAVGVMLSELRRLTAALRGASAETSTMATQITAGSEQMAQAAAEMSTTSVDLSRQSTEMAKTIRALAGDAGQLVMIAAELDAGAHEGVERNTRLRALAGENRERLDESTKALEALAADVRASAEAIAALSEASAQVRDFVTFVQKMARQSKLLALNASMEAARAGEHGQGFAVVAGEVRRLAAQAAEAAERTEALVKNVLEKIEQSRASASRTVETVRVVLGATQHGYESFGQIERAVADADAWTQAIEHAADVSNQLVNEMTRRLEVLARGTDGFAAAMQHVATSSQEQSASTQQIAAAATALALAAEKLSKLVTSFRLERTTPVIGARASAALRAIREEELEEELERISA